MWKRAAERGLWSGLWGAGCGERYLRRDRLGLRAALRERAEAGLVGRRLVDVGFDVINRGVLTDHEVIDLVDDQDRILEVEIAADEALVEEAVVTALERVAHLWEQGCVGKGGSSVVGTGLWKGMWKGLWRGLWKGLWKGL